MKNKGNKVLNIIIVLIIIALIACVAFLIVGKSCGGTAHSEYTNNENSTEQVTTADGLDIEDYLVDNPIDFKSIQETNDEVIAWIQIPDTNVDYPILQSMKDDNYYLYKDLNGNYDINGSVYIQICNSYEFTDRVTVAYGHNMLDGSMFADLHKFEDKEFFDSHDTFYVYTPNRRLTYQVVSAYTYDDRHIMNSFNFAEDEVFQEYIDYIQNPRSTTKNVREELDHELTIDDRIITLSTCTDYGDGRYLLQGVLIKDELTR